ncbi:hypothetical protein M378DRAFT_10428 [Amanita muscaria Koide BX008]|uniref:Uncharacterized protein n=1 Tax=Amanita muscaria (strain Koide BX008) TaxID=946122 RepID=A0A0C2XBF4_AMAMK|nr:hypothetical protein M378DRAFT_10428 [Amanita muscaria Koide BX008]
MNTSQAIQRMFIRFVIGWLTEEGDVQIEILSPLHSETISLYITAGDWARAQAVAWTMAEGKLMGSALQPMRRRRRRCDRAGILMHE